MTHLIGILNVTPDSFSDGGKYDQTEAALMQCKHLFASGAEWVDVGAESTRPGALTVSLEDEWDRMKDFWEAVLADSSLDITRFSLDTRNAVTAEKFLALGGRIINDVSGFQDEAMINVAAQFQAWCMVNHFPGKTVNEVHEQKISSIEVVQADLLRAAEKLMAAGVKREQIILDPGIGFGKTPELNQRLLTFASVLPEWPVLIGHSKKRFLGENRYDQTVNVAAGLTAINSGAAYLRVHEPEWYKKTET